MELLRKHRYALLFLVCAVLLVAWWHAATAINSWPMVNPQVAKGKPVYCFGDSLVSSQGASARETGYPAQLSQALGCEVAVLGYPGATAGAAREHLAELPADMSGTLAIVTLGGNDLLNHTPWAQTEKDLSTVFAELHRRGAMVAYTAVESPLLGGGMATRHRRLCREHGVVLVPNVLKGISTDPGMRSDQIHPNDAGYRLMAERTAAIVRRFL